jgi:hypothetical protein
VTESAEKHLENKGFEHMELEPETIAPQRTSSLDEFE